MVKSKKKSKELIITGKTLEKNSELNAEPTIVRNEQPKNLSANVQKLRFMKIAELEQEQNQLKLHENTKQSEMQWCVAGWEGVVQEALKSMRKQSKSYKPAYVQARRSYGGMNKIVEAAALKISKRIVKQKNELEETQQAYSVIASKQRRHSSHNKVTL